MSSITFDTLKFLRHEVACKAVPMELKGTTRVTG